MLSCPPPTRLPISLLPDVCSFHFSSLLCRDCEGIHNSKSEYSFDFFSISGVAPLNLVVTRNKKTTGVLFIYFIHRSVKHFLNKQNSASMDILFTNCHGRSPGGKPNLSRLNKSFHKSARLESSSVISSGCLEFISKLLIHAGAESK